MIYKTNKIVEDALKVGNTDYYAFIVPKVGKVALKLTSIPLSTTASLVASSYPRKIEIGLYDPLILTRADGNIAGCGGP